jgi:hypothetical protein
MAAPDVPKIHKQAHVENSALGNEAARDLSSRPETLTDDQAKQMLTSQESSSIDKLRAAEALYKSGIKQIQMSDQDGKNRTYAIELIRLAGKQNMVHIFGQDDHGVRRVVLRGVSSADGTISKERGADGKLVDFEGSWWSKNMAQRSPMLQAAAHGEQAPGKSVAKANPEDLVWKNTEARFTDVRAGQHYVAAAHSTIAVESGGEAILNPGAIAAVAPGGKIRAALPGSIVNTFGQNIEIHNYGARVYYKGSVDITNLPEKDHPGIKIVNEDLASLDQNIGRRPKDVAQPTVVVARRIEPNNRRESLIALNQLPTVEFAEQ